MPIGKWNFIYCAISIILLISKFNYSDELKIGGIFIRIYNEMPTFPIENPKSLVIDLLEYLNQGYKHLTSKKPTVNHVNKNIMNSAGGILIPTLAHNHPQRQMKVPEKNIDGVLNEYNRSKMINQLEKTNENSNHIKYDFEWDVDKTVDNIIMAMKALTDVIKANPNIEIQCIGHFEMLFGFLSSSLCEKVNS